jgi:N-acetylmuramoyl-L-alanine amidase
MLIAIDAGHGYNTPGKRAVDGSMREWEFNNAVANYVAQELSNYEGVSYFFTHDTTGKTDVPLATRTNLANSKKADFFLSIHANANTGTSWGTWGGIETYIHDSCANGSKTYNIGLTIHNNLMTQLQSEGFNLRNRGLKKADFHVLRETSMPAVLVEAPFMDNKEELALLKSDAYRRAHARGLVRGLAQAFGLRRKAAPTPPPAPSSSGGKEVYYRVVVGSFKDKAEAEKLRQELLGKGYSGTFLAAFDK